jgi:uncharacterized protein YkwD
MMPQPAGVRGRRVAVLLTVVVAGGQVAIPTAVADNSRLNNGVATNIYTIHRQQHCPEEVSVNPTLRLAAEWHTNDVLNNRALNGDIGSDGSGVQDRARAAGYVDDVAETVAINPALAISGIELLNQWYANPDYLAIMRDCTYTQVGVWSANSLDRTVVVAVFGRPR